MSTDHGITWATESACRDCKRTVRHKPHGGPHRWHGCRLRWIARRIAHAKADGWWNGYEAGRLEFDRAEKGGDQ